MTSHSPTRWLAPLALLASLVAVFVIYSNTVGGGDEPAEPASGTTTTARGESDGRGARQDDEGSGDTGATAGAASTGPRTYRVRAGDTLGGIAERTGVSVDRIVELNPDVDAQSLSVGQTLRLRGGG
jgi:LysM repeat protein